MRDPHDIDLVSNSQELDLLRSVLLRPSNELVEKQRIEIEQLRARVVEFADLRDSLGEIEALRSRLVVLERLVIDLTGRTTAVDEVLVEAVRTSERRTGELGEALQGEIEHAVYSSARTEGSALAEALYPVIGPAVRKMIAAMFSSDNGGLAFVVEQILLIEKSTGLMLASAATDAQALDDADIVSGMIDALTSFVQDAFAASENDGFSDLRVGDLSLLVESGPHAVLASVVRGIPSQDYRNAAARALESIHVEYGDDLSKFDGSIEVFGGIADNLKALHEEAATRSSRSLLVLTVVATVFMALLIILGFGLAA